MNTCPACDGGLSWHHNGLWCERCRRKVETCCEGAPQCAPEPVQELRSTGLPANDPC